MFKYSRRAQKAWKILDVGIRAGHLGRCLKEGLGCFVVGIGIDKRVVEIARKLYDKMIIANTEEVTTIGCSSNYFDTIVPVDILEHLKRPDSICLATFYRRKTYGMIRQIN